LRRSPCGSSVCRKLCRNPRGLPHKTSGLSLCQGEPLRQARELPHGEAGMDTPEPALRHSDLGLPHTPRALHHADLGLPHTPRALRHADLELPHAPRALRHRELALCVSTRALRHTDPALRHTPRALSHATLGLPHRPRALRHAMRTLCDSPRAGCVADLGANPPRTALVRQPGSRGDSVSPRRSARTGGGFRRTFGRIANNPADGRREEARIPRRLGGFGLPPAHTAPGSRRVPERAVGGCALSEEGLRQATSFPLLGELGAISGENRT